MSRHNHTMSEAERIMANKAIAPSLNAAACRCSRSRCAVCVMSYCCAVVQLSISVAMRCDNMAEAALSSSDLW